MKKLFSLMLVAVTVLLFAGSVSAQQSFSSDEEKAQWIKANPDAYQAEMDKMKAQSAENTNLVGLAAPPDYPRFISFPTSHKKPPLIENGNKEEARLVYELRMQHWLFIFDQDTYKKKYGALPTTLPYGLTPEEYAKNPPSDAFSEDLERYIETGQ